MSTTVADVLSATHPEPVSADEMPADAGEIVQAADQPSEQAPKSTPKLKPIAPSPKTVRSGLQPGLRAGLPG